MTIVYLYDKQFYVKFDILLPTIKDSGYVRE